MGVLRQPAGSARGTIRTATQRPVWDRPSLRCGHETFALYEVGVLIIKLKWFMWTFRDWNEIGILSFIVTRNPLNGLVVMHFRCVLSVDVLTAFSCSCLNHFGVSEHVTQVSQPTVLSLQVHTSGSLFLHPLRGMLKPPGRWQGGVVWLPPVCQTFPLENDAQHWW